MRIPLDYYRILGIPTQTDLTQLEQAYRDRLQQLPQREYSDLAIASRKELITVAYQVLSDPVLKDEYDRSFLLHRQKISPIPKQNQLPTIFSIFPLLDHQN